MEKVPVKVVIWNCDKCGKKNTLVAYHHKYGWYCEDCLIEIRDKMDHCIEAVEMKKKIVNETLSQEDIEI